jgi:hypothetical protein
VLLDRHSALAITPETAFYDEVAAEPAAMLRRLSAWRRLPELGLCSDEVLAAAGPDPTPRSMFAAILELYGRSRGRPFVGEKTPQHWRHAGRLLADFPGAQILWLIRDGRDVVRSLSESPWWRGGIEAAARLWRHSSESAAAASAEFPGRIQLVRYERLVDAPERALGEVMARLGLELEPGQLDPARPSGVVLERSMPWKGRALEAIDPGRIGRWREDGQTLEAVEPILRPQLAGFSYIA